MTPAEIDAALAALHEAGAIYLADGAVVAAYPLSLRPARHRINIGTAMIFANCAVDALAVCSIVDEPAVIISDCVHCGAAIQVRMKGTRVLAAQPESVAIFYLSRTAASPAVLTRCPHINFFCDHSHAARWQAAHPERKGIVLTLAEANGLARERFAAVIRAFRGGTLR